MGPLRFFKVADGRELGFLNCYVKCISYLKRLCQNIKLFKQAYLQNKRGSTFSITCTTKMRPHSEKKSTSKTTLSGVLISWFLVVLTGSICWPPRYSILSWSEDCRRNQWELQGTQKIYTARGIVYPVDFRLNEAAFWLPRHQRRQFFPLLCLIWKHLCHDRITLRNL